jgi:hypothetical protein
MGPLQILAQLQLLPQIQIIIKLLFLIMPLVMKEAPTYFKEREIWVQALEVLTLRFSSQEKG